MKKSGHGEGRSTTHVQGPEKFACQNEAVGSSLLAGDSTLAARLGKSLMYLRDPATGVPRPFAEAKGILLYRFSYPADFGGANFPVPWTTGKAAFVIHSNFFTPSLLKGGKF